MAEFSREWLMMVGVNNLPGDFSVMEVFNSLNNGESIRIICEGFGFTAIVNQASKCYVLVNGQLQSFESLENNIY